MRSIHSVLRSEHHIRHFARRQYGLFLKGIGMSMESSLEFFRREFAIRMDSDKVRSKFSSCIVYIIQSVLQFFKEHGYNIRHMYGKEGKRVEGRPFSCPTIILGNAPAASDCHGY